MIGEDVGVGVGRWVGGDGWRCLGDRDVHRHCDLGAVIRRFVGDGGIERSGGNADQGAAAKVIINAAAKPCAPN